MDENYPHLSCSRGRSPVYPGFFLKDHGPHAVAFITKNRMDKIAFGGRVNRINALRIKKIFLVKVSGMQGWQGFREGFRCKQFN